MPTGNLGFPSNMADYALLYFMGALFTAFGLRILYMWIKDLLFYHKNRWNFSIESEMTNFVRRGHEDGPPMSAPGRLFFGFPMFGFGGLLVGFFAFRDAGL